MARIGRRKATERLMLDAGFDRVVQVTPEEMPLEGDEARSGP